MANSKLTQSQTNTAVGIEKNSDAKRLINLVSIGPSWPRFLAMIYEHSLCITPGSRAGLEPRSGVKWVAVQPIVMFSPKC